VKLQGGQKDHLRRARRGAREKSAPLLRCYYGSPWLDHFRPPIGTGRGCLFCAQMSELPFSPQPKPRSRLVSRKAKRRAEESAWVACCRAVDARDGGRCRCCKRFVVRTLTLCPERAEHHHLAGRTVRGLRCDPRAVCLLCAECHQRVTRHEVVITSCSYFEFNGRSVVDADCPLVFGVSPDAP
jgi:hypothetical protein